MLKKILINSKGNLNRFFTTSKNSGKEMFFPKYGNSFYEPGINLPDKRGESKGKKKVKKNNKKKNKNPNSDL